MTAGLDTQFAGFAYRPPELTHRYGPNVHLLADPLALTLLARACHPEVGQPEMGRLVTELYRVLAHVVVGSELPRHEVSVPTRMLAAHPRGIWTGPLVDLGAKAVVVALARAGLVPAQVVYDFLHHVLSPVGVRQDHLMLARSTDASGQVTGAAIGGAKIGGGIDGRFLVIPDPMGATGSTISTVLRHYDKEVAGEAARIIALHLIVTPEYLRHLRDHHPGVVVYAFRLDRGLSSPEVLATVPGTHWDEERGLDEHHYIVPGGGGIGEVMNNAFC